MRAVINDIDIGIDIEHNCRNLTFVYIGDVFKVKTLVTATCDSHYSTCLGHLWQRDRDRIISIFGHATQGGQGKYSHMLPLTSLYVYVCQCRWHYCANLCKWKHSCTNVSHV